MESEKINENEEKNQKDEKNNYDFLILGSGGAGLAAGMYAARLGLKTLILGHSHGSELPIGGVITTTDIVENYPGFKKIKGIELAKKFEEHAKEYENVEIKNEEAIEIKKINNLFLIKTKKSEYVSSSILFATGTKWKKLPKEIKGSEEFEGKGISYCALCDGPLFRGKNIAVIGGANSAAKDALVLSEYAKKVYIIYRKEKIRAEPIHLEKIKSKGNIEIINNTNIIEIKGGELINKVVLDKPYNNKYELDIDGIFVAIGHIILSDLAKSIGVEVNDSGEIIIDHKTSKTNINGIFAAGDVTDKPFKQLITSVADGCTAAYSAYEYITNTKISLYD